ncbi:MAG TPA: aspartate--tRNA ligase, partial [Firmicutes bacterium]|nr:aspartate--tRNA ligase [Bacillota bacterium]
MKDWIRTKYCGELRKSDAGSTVILNGWVNRRRDLGQLIFVDLRDRSGLVQVVFDPETLGPEQFQQAEGLRSEYVIAVQGQVVARPQGQVNPNLATGGGGGLVSSLVVLAGAKTPPFPLDRAGEGGESPRLKDPHLPLRSRELQGAFAMRHRTTAARRPVLDRPG